VRKQLGVSLLELVVAMAIVGILASIAYPSYQRYLVKSRRADAQGALLELAGFLERSYTVNGCYFDKGDDGICGNGDDSTPNLPFVSLLANGSRSMEAFPANMSYAFTLEVGFSGNTYTLSATPSPDSSQASDGALRVDQAGRKFWDKDNSGDFDEGENGW